MLWKRLSGMGKFSICEESLSCTVLFKLWAYVLRVYVWSSYNSIRYSYIDNYLSVGSSIIGWRKVIALVHFLCSYFFQS